MASLSERTLIHYSKQPLTQLQNYMHSQFALLRKTGKPIGFWYAYGQDWKNYINTHDEKKSGHSKENTTYRYEFTIPEEAFTIDIKAASPNTILELSKANLDEFMKTFFNKKESYIGLNFLLEQSLDQYRLKGENMIIEELRSKSEEFKVFLDEKISSKKKVSVKTIVKDAKAKFPALFQNYFPSIQAQKDYGASICLWSDLWSNVDSAFGGVEFHPDLFDIESWDNIWLPWTSVLDIRSGVIFRSTKFRDGILSQQLSAQTVKGGRRHTRRRHRNRRKTRRNH
jgi:hypothetical protein